jgi:hypothetical protein
MTINANIKSDASSCPYAVHFLRGFRYVFRGRHLQFVLSVSVHFISPAGNWRTLNLWPWFFRQWFAVEDIARSAVHLLCIVYEFCLWKKYQHVKLIWLYFKLFSDSREEMFWSLVVTGQYQKFEICWDVLMANFQIKWQELYKHRLFRYGVPFLIFVLGGSFGLKEFTSLRWT